MKFSGFLFLLLLHRSCSALNVVAPGTHNALIGSTTLIPCSFTVNSPPINSQFLAILWQYGEKELVRYDSKESSASPRLSIDQKEARHGNASLTIHNVTIADHGVYKCLVIYSPDKSLKEIQVNTHAAPKVTLVKKALSKNGKNRLLCLITNLFPKDVTVTWLRNGQALNGSELGIFERNADETYRVNSSLTISAKQSQDHPDITCQVKHVFLSDPIQDAFTVRYGVEPKITFFSAHNGDTDIYVCEVKEFNPEDLEIKWLIDGKRVEPSRRNADDTYNKWDHFLISGNQKRPNNISCVVGHETLDSPLMKTLIVKDRKDSQTTGLIAAVSVLTILLTAVFFAALWIYKSKYFQRFQLSPIHIRWNGNRDEKLTMCCTASNCPEKIQVTWTVVEDDGEKMRVPDHQTQGDGEHCQLLNGDYTVRTDQSETDSFYNTITSLTFRPSPAKHRNMKVTCSFLSGSTTKEKHQEWRFTVLRPRLSAPMTFSLDNSGDVVCSVTLEKFYPEDIQIKWSCGVGNYQELDSVKTEAVKNDSENTFGCKSECHVPNHLFQDPGFRLRVIWTHMSLDQHDSREVSSKDLPWRPVMGDITVPPLVHGTESRMQCVIRGYFPDYLEVKWLRREAGKPELYEVSSDKYKIPIMEIIQETDNTYTCTTSLIVFVSAKTEQGAEFICRVTHPCLEGLLEKRTGDLTVKGKPVIRRIVRYGRYIILEVDGFYMQDPVVTWEQSDNRHGQYKRYEEKHIQNMREETSDGSSSLTSICEALTVTGRTNPKDKYIKATIEHGALESPENIYFLRSKRSFYLLSGSEKKTLDQLDQETLQKCISNHLKVNDF